jgi:hypothetical protein
VKRLALLALLACVPVATAHADGCPISECATSGSPLPGSRLLAYRPVGQQGPLVAYDVVSGKRRFRLPPGILSANGRAFVALGNGELERYDPHTGRFLGATAVAGDRALAAVSATGRYAVLYWQLGPSTTFWIYRDGRLARTVGMGGVYQPETISPDGRRLYLIHWHAAAFGYDLRVYDFSARTLEATKLAAKEKMSGTPYDAIATRDGRWLLTLYLRADDTAFIHALDLRNGVAHCIDLPDAGPDFQTLGAYALALSPDEHKLYLANEFMRTVYVVDLVHVRLARTARFYAELSGPGAGNAGPSAAMSPNGRMLYFTSGDRLVFAYDTAYGRVTKRWIVAKPDYGAQTSAGALAVTPDGKRLFVVRTDRRVLSLRTS